MIKDLHPFACDLRRLTRESAPRFCAEQHPQITSTQPPNSVDKSWLPPLPLIDKKAECFTLLLS
jgi:hypothetical protein